MVVNNVIFVNVKIRVCGKFVIKLISVVVRSVIIM